MTRSSRHRRPVRRPARSFVNRCGRRRVPARRSTRTSGDCRPDDHGKIGTVPAEQLEEIGQRNPGREVGHGTLVETPKNASIFPLQPGRKHPCFSLAKDTNAPSAKAHPGRFRLIAAVRPLRPHRRRYSIGFSTVKTSLPSCTSPTTLPPGRTFPSRIRRATGFSTCSCTARLSGRAPN